LLLLAAVLIAVVVSLALVVLETVLAPTPELGLVPGNTKRAFRSIQQYPEAETIPGVVIMRVEAPLIFFNAPSVCAQLRAIVYGSGYTPAVKNNGASTRAVVLDLSNVPYIDSAAIEGFSDLIDQYKRAEVLLVFANPNSNVLHRLYITPLRDAINSQFGEQRDWFFLTVSDAVDAVKRYEPPMKPLKVMPDAEKDASQEEDGSAEEETAAADAKV
jgi:MFS superfamily sulfate permease-like transporter